MSCSCRSNNSQKKGSKSSNSGCRRRRISRDIVILRFIDVAATITDFSITGSAEPCTPLIAVGRRVSEARHCLLLSGFIIQERTPRTLVFVRTRLRRLKTTKK